MATERRKYDDEDTDMSTITVKTNVQEIESFKNVNNEMSFDEALMSAKSLMKNDPVYTARFLSEGSKSTLTLDRLHQLCDNPQGDLAKVQEIITHARKACNISDLHGAIFSAIENNTNPSYRLQFPAEDSAKNSKTQANKVKKINELLTEKFFSVNKFDHLIGGEIVPLAYLEGNKILNLRQTKDGKYSVESYPLGIAEISDYKANGEYIVNISVQTLKKTLESLGIRSKSKKKENLTVTIEEELKKHYPEEVYKAFTSNEKFAQLNYRTSGVIRNKNMGGKYGVSAFLPSFKSMIQLDTIDASDNTNARARAKKFIVQILNDKLLGVSGRDKHFAEMSYANDNLFEAAQRDAVVVTLPAYSKGIQLLEFKNTMTPIENINYYRYQMMNALGIGFLAVDSNTKMTATDVSFKEIIKTVNRLNKQLSDYFSKCIRYIIEEEAPNLVDFCPTFVIEDSAWLDNELRVALSTFLFTMLGSSYETAYGLIGIDAQEEKRRREQENEMSYDEIFKPRASMYTTAGGNAEEKNTDKKEENQNPDKDKQEEDKVRNAKTT